MIKKLYLKSAFTKLVITFASLVSFVSNAATIKDLSFQGLPGERVQIAIGIDGELADPLSFTINNPPRIALDFKNTSSSLVKKYHPVNLGLAKSINVVSQGERTRMVVNLSEMTPFTLQRGDGKLFVTLDASGGSVALPKIQSGDNKLTGVGSSVDSNRVESVDFRRGENGEGRIIIDLGSSNLPINVSQEGNKVIADVLGASISSEMLQRLDVIDFATPVKFVDVTEVDSGVRVSLIPMIDNYEHLAYQSDDRFTVELKPISKEEQEKLAKAKFGYTGERLSLNFQDIEVRSVLQLIADFTGLNVVVSDKVTGTLTLRLKNVPWDQALDIILKTKGLDKRKSGNVLLIAPTEEIAAQEKLALEARKQVKELAPLRTEYIQVNYAKAKDIKRILTEGGSKGSLVSQRGSLKVDDRTNVIILNDTSENIEQIKALLSRLDKPVRQVLIEARIVIANEDFSKDLGARFGFTGDSFGIGSTGTGQVTSGNLSATTDAINNDTIPLNDRLNFNLPAPTGSGSLGLALAKLPGDSFLELELSALQSSGDGEIVSTPRVITSNQKEATIEQGVEVGYQEESASGGTTIAFKDAVLKLTVTPQITPDEKVILDLTVQQDDVGELVAGIPTIDKRQVKTEVLIDDGSTVVLGGIFQHTTRDSTRKVPFFGDLPGIGRFFRNTNKINNKSEVLIFVTPKIMRDNIEFN